MDVVAGDPQDIIDQMIVDRELVGQDGDGVSRDHTDAAERKQRMRKASLELLASRFQGALVPRSSTSTAVSYTHVCFAKKDRDGIYKRANF